jgi:transposase
MTYIGIDIGADWLDLAATDPVRGLPRRVRNDEHGIARVIAALTAAAPPLVVVEATGVYHRPLLTALLTAEVPTTLLNPRQLVHYRAERLGREKSDRADAALLAEYGATHDADLRRAVLPTPAQAKLRELVTYRDRLMADCTRLRNRAHANTYGGDPQVGDWLRRNLDAVQTWLAEAEAAIAQLLAEVPEAAVVQTVPGVGKTIAAAVLAYLPPELWGDAKKAAAFAGVHPRQEQSGQRDHSRLSKQGHARLRRYLYCGATVALQHDPALIAFRDRVQATGHAKRSAHCAVMHKLLRQMMGAIRRSYHPEAEIAMPHAA